MGATIISIFYFVTKRLRANWNCISFYCFLHLGIPSKEDGKENLYFEEEQFVFVSLASDDISRSRRAVLVLSHNNNQSHCIPSTEREGNLHFDAVFVNLDLQKAIQNVESCLTVMSRDFVASEERISRSSSLNLFVRKCSTKIIDKYRAISKTLTIIIHLVDILNSDIGLYLLKYETQQAKKVTKKNAFDYLHLISL